MKIVLFTPNFPSTQQTKKSHVSLGLLMIATMVQDNHQVHVVNGGLDGLDEDELVKKIEKNHPTLVGVSINFAPALGPALSVVKKLRQNGYDGFVVAGGNTATFLYRELLTDGVMDIVVLNEGEVTFTELVSLLGNKCTDDLLDELMSIKGIAFRDRNKTIHLTEGRGLVNDLDSLPFPNRDYHEEFYACTDTAGMMTSRGCPFDCFYCSTTQMWGSKWRARSPENIIREMKEIKGRYRNIDYFEFQDDNLLVSRPRIEKLANALRAERLDIGVGFCSRPEHLDKKLLDMLSGVGAKGMFVGIESGSSRVLQLMGRRYTRKEVIDKVAYAESLGIRVTASFMIGIPFESEEDVGETFNLLREIPASTTQCHIFTPFVGTPCYEKPEEFGIIALYESAPGNISLDQEAYIATHYLSRKRIQSLYRKGVSITLQKGFLRELTQRTRKEGRMDECAEDYPSGS